MELDGRDVPEKLGMTLSKTIWRVLPSILWACSG